MLFMCFALRGKPRKNEMVDKKIGAYTHLYTFAAYTVRVLNPFLNNHGIILILIQLRESLAVIYWAYSDS